MKITLKGKQYSLRDNEVKFAKEVVSGFIKHARMEYSDRSTFRAYLTFLIVMFVMAQDCVEQFDTEEFDTIFDEVK